MARGSFWRRARAFFNIAAHLAAFQAKERAATSSAAGAAAEAIAEKHKQEMAVQAIQAAVEGRRLDSAEYLCNRLTDKVNKKPPAGRDFICKSLLDALRACSRKFELELKERALDRTLTLLRLKLSIVYYR